MDTLLRDIRFGLKLLWKDRGHAATTILTLAVCIGANTALFTIVNSVLLRPLPVPESERILLMANQYPNAGTGRSTFSGIVDYHDRLRDISAFEEQALFDVAGQTVEVNGVSERVTAMVATPSLFRLLRVSPVLGQTFDDSDGQTGNEQKVLLSFGFWQQFHAGDPGVAGRELRLGGRPFTVVGVMPRDFSFMDPEVRFWTPAAFTDQQKSDESRHNNGWYNIGRLKPGATLSQAQAQLDALNAANLDRFPQWKELLVNAGFYSSIEPLQDVIVRDVRGTLYLLWGGAGLLLMIGAVNITNLALARSQARLKEVATRLALGAARGRVARQLLTESVLTSLAGGLVGLALGSISLGAVAAIGLDRLPRASEVQLDATVVAFTLTVAIAAGIVIGLVPVTRLFSLDISRALHDETRSETAGRGARAARRILVVAQVGFAFVLLIGAGLLLASFRELLAVDPGFTADGVTTATIIAPGVRYPGEAEQRIWMRRMLEVIRAVPGVTAAGATSTIPFGSDFSDSVILAEGYQMRPGESLISPYQVIVTPGYFEAMNIRLARGRYFNERDGETARPVVIVDEKLANRFWPNQDPTGRRMYRPSNPDDLLRVDENTRWLTVVGVVRNVRVQNLAGDQNLAGTYYFPYDQNPRRGAFFAFKTAVDPDLLLRTVRAEVAKVDADLPLFDVRTMTERKDLSLANRRTAMLLALVFGAVALFLSAIGVYGVLAYIVARRSREIGIRIALGSSTQEIFTLILREGGMLTAAGLALGSAGAVALQGAVASLLYGVSPMEPAVVGLATLVLAAVALLASVLPARRATQVDPVIVLNQQ